MIEQARASEKRALVGAGNLSLRRTRLSDTSELEELFEPHAECMQLRLQPFSAEATVLDAGAIRIVAHASESSFRLRRRAGEGRLLIGYASRASALLRWGRDCRPADFIVIGGGEADISILGSSEFVWLDIDVPELQQPDLMRLRDAVPGCAILTPADDCCAALRGYVAGMLQMCFADPLLLQHPAMRRDIEKELLDRLSRMVRLTELSACTSKRERKVSSLVQRAEQFMWENVEEPITLERICAATNSRMRSLIYCFKEAFGLGPITYLKIRRLDAAHRRLKETRGSVPIVDVAADFGFWHMGHFSVDYKRMFGATASQTVAAARTQNGDSLRKKT